MPTTTMPETQAHQPLVRQSQSRAYYLPLELNKNPIAIGPAIIPLRQKSINQALYADIIIKNRCRPLFKLV